MNSAHIIGVTGASGGVGASVLTVALAARAAARGRRVACLDARPYGGGLDVLLGVEHEKGLRWVDLTRAHGALDGLALLAELPTSDGIPVVSFERAAPPELGPEAYRSVLDGLAGHVDLLLIDLPARESPAWPWLTAVLDDGILVCGGSPSALAAAAAAAESLDAAVERWWLAQRVGRSRDDLPEAVSEALGMPLLTVLADDSRIGTDLLRGRCPGRRGALARAADTALEGLLTQQRRIA